VKLSDLTLPLSYAEGQAYALVFSQAFLDELAALYDSYGSTRCVPVPRVLTDGRLMLCGDVLSEVGEGGLLCDLWQHAAAAGFAADVDVVPWDEVVPLLPVAVAEPTQTTVDQAFREAATL